jgi:hypothetical protein
MLSDAFSPESAGASPFAALKGTFPPEKSVLSEMQERSIFRRMRKGERILSGRRFLQTKL